MIELSPNMIGRRLKVLCNDGKIYSGECSSYISALDNEPEIESISIGEIEIFQPNIKSIKEIN